MTVMQHPELTQDEAMLRSWDWRASLRREERGVPWLARKTGKAQSTVYAYAYGNSRPTLAWLRTAYDLLERQAA